MLNQKQKEAIEHTNSPLVIFAGPGTGKTTTLEKKFEHLIINQGIKPENILGLTFTKNAANELKQRISETTKIPVEDLNIHTFHSFGLKVIQQNTKNADLEAGFTVISAEKQNQHIHSIFKEIQMPWNTNYLPNIRQKLSKAKREQQWGNTEKFGIDDWVTKTTKEIYPYYQAILKANNEIDFDDIIIKVNKVFRENKGTLNSYKQRFKYILLDEAQDTDNSQKEILNNLKPQNITVVGDPNQSIYKFRGSNPEFMKEFIESFNAKEIQLEENYRNPQSIIDASSELIQNNDTIFLNKLVSKSKEKPRKVKILITHDEQQEAERIINLITENNLKDVAILYRTNNQAYLFENELQKNGIPYQNIAGTSFNDRKEINSALSILTLTYNDDEKAFTKTLINQSSIGIKTIEKIINHARITKQTLLSAMYEKIERMTEEQHQTLKRISNIYKEIEPLSKKEKVEILFNTLLPTPENKEQKERIQILKNSILNSNTTLKEFIENQKGENLSNEHIKLSTLHGAKGKEFNHVFITGVETDLLPFSQENIEEERRLFYVGLTRTKKTVTLSIAKHRTIDLIRNQQETSQFVDEISQKEYL